MPPEWNVRSPKDQRDLEIFCDAENLRRGGIEITKALEVVAGQRCVSFETARAAYYAWRASLKETLSKIPEKIQKDAD
jgi:hypothetical protein